GHLRASQRRPDRAHPAYPAGPLAQLLRRHRPRSDARRPTRRPIYLGAPRHRRARSRRPIRSVGPSRAARYLAPQRGREEEKRRKGAEERTTTRSPFLLCPFSPFLLFSAPLRRTRNLPVTAAVVDGARDVLAPELW